MDGSVKGCERDIKEGWTLKANEDERQEDCSASQYGRAASGQ